MLGTLPKFSNGLKLVRIGVFIMLLQLVLSIVMTIKAFGASTAQDARDALTWTQYFMLANIAAALAMLVGTLRAIPELRRTKVDATSLVIAAAGFAVTAAAQLWTYRALSNFIDVVLNPSSFQQLASAVEDLKSLKYVVFVKDLGYWIGLISLIGMVRRSAIANDQLALRDVAASMGRALLVMFVADVFFQFMYGLGEGGGGVPVIGAIGSLLVLAYWIYCHVRLQRFLFNAAYFMNEPHNLPTATALNIPDEKPAKKKPAPRTSQPAIARASQPTVAAVPPAPRPALELPPRPSQQAVAPPPPPVGRPASNAEGEPSAGEPRFLR